MERNITSEEASFFDNMAKESDRQDSKFPAQWDEMKDGGYLAVAILMEEVGELSQAILQRNLDNAKTEALQVATVAMRIHQFLSRY